MENIFKICGLLDILKIQELKKTVKTVFKKSKYSKNKLLIF